MAGKLIVGPRERTLSLGGGDKMKQPPFGANDARRVLRDEAATLQSEFGRAQEFMSGEGVGVQGDALCADWNLFKRLHRQKPNLATALLTDALNHYMQGPKLLGEKMVALGIQEYTTYGDFPAAILDIIEKYHTGIEDIDVGWREIYDVKDFTGSKTNGFRIRDVSSTLTFRIVPTGDKVEVYEMSGSDVEVNFNRYGGALGWDRSWFEDEEYWMATDTAMEFRQNYYNDLADVHYALIEALGAGINLAWEAPSPTGLANTDAQYELSRDINTINQAALNIFTDLQDAGMNVTPNTPLILLAPLALRARINRALAAVYGMASLRNPTQVEYSIRPVYTLRLTSTTQYYVCMPKKKAKSGIRKDLEVFTDFDILSYSDVTAGWGRYGAGIGESEQFVRCAIS